MLVLEKYVNLSEKRAQIDTNSSGTFDIGDETDILNSIEKLLEIVLIIHCLEIILQIF